MPKIIENLEERLIAEARKQIKESGYAATTIRSVAKACGVGVGTVYNYFPSKDALLATYLAEDWNQCYACIEAVQAAADSPEPIARCIHDQLRQYAHRHQTLFQDKDAAADVAAPFGKYHAMLRRQLARPLRAYCDSDFCAEFIAQALLTWTIEGQDFDRIYPLLRKLF